MEKIMENEAWKPVVGYEDLYEVSNLGRVWSVKKNIFRKLRKDRDGYLVVDLCKNGKKEWPQVHRLVAKAFIPNPENLPQVNHKDEDKTNNQVSNLEWCTPEQNNNHGTRNKRAAEKLSKPIKQLSLDGELIAIWKSSMEIYRQKKYDYSLICKCCRGERNKHKGFKWEYVTD